MVAETIPFGSVEYLKEDRSKEDGKLPSGWDCVTDVWGATIQETHAKITENVTSTDAKILITGFCMLTKESQTTQVLYRKQWT